VVSHVDPSKTQRRIGGDYRSSAMNRVISIRSRMNKSNKSSLAALLAASLAGAATLSTAAEREPVMVSAYYGSGSVIFFYGAEAVWTPGCECEWLTR